MTTTHAYIDPDDSSRSPGIITAVPAALILVVELYVPHTVLKNAPVLAEQRGHGRAVHEAHRQNAASPIEPGSPRRLKSW